MKKIFLVLSLSSLLSPLSVESQELKRDGHVGISYFYNQVFIWKDSNDSLGSLWTNREGGQTVLRVKRQSNVSGQPDLSQEFHTNIEFYGKDAWLSDDAVYFHTRDGQDKLSIARLDRKNFETFITADPDKIRLAFQRVIGESDCSSAKELRYAEALGQPATWDGRISIPAEVMCFNKKNYQYYIGILVLNSDLPN